MYTINRSYHNTSQELIDEYLSNGGKVTVCPAGATTEGIEYNNGFYKKKKSDSPTAGNDNSEES